jgi:2-iminobutanoate/2-iminopropanoate deaminase
MSLRPISAAGATKPIAPYSPAIDTGSLVFVSGQIGADPYSGELLDGLTAQAERVLMNIVAILDAAGLTMSDVAKTTCFLADINDFSAFNEVYVRFFSDPKPARSTYQVAALPRGARIEIEAIAVRSV